MNIEELKAFHRQATAGPPVPPDESTGAAWKLVNAFQGLIARLEALERVAKAAKKVVNPMGYLPKDSVAVMRVVMEDMQEMEDALDAMEGE